jgi:hypothetical protein
MANQDKPFGFKLVGNMAGDNSGRVNEYNIESGSTQGIFSGDPVKMLTGGFIDVADAAGDTKILGIFRGCKFVNASSKEVEFSAHFPAAQTATGDIVAFVEDNPFNLYEVQCTGSLARTDIGANVDIGYTAGSTVTGQSAAEVGSSSGASTANYRIVGVSKDSENNELGSANVNVIVLINEHAYKIEAGI